MKSYVTDDFIGAFGMSLDGYSTGPGNNVMALPMDEAFDAYNAERLRRRYAAAGTYELR